MTRIALVFSLVIPSMWSANVRAAEPPVPIQRPTPKPEASPPELAPQPAVPTPAATPTPAAAPTPTAAPTPAPTPDPQAVRRVRRLTIAGAVTLSLGLAGLAPTITCTAVIVNTLFSRGPEFAFPCVVATGITASVLISTGSVLLGASHLERKRLERLAPVAVTPMLLRDGGGVGVVFAF